MPACPSPVERAVALEEALDLVLAGLGPGGAESVPLASARGRRLALRLVAPFDLWPFSRAAMDGFAVRSDDTRTASPGQPLVLRICGVAFAGDPGGRAAAPGCAVRVMTGAAMPQGTDAVIPLEEAEELALSDGATGIRLRRAVSPGRNVFPRGEDAQAGQALLEAGHLITPGTVGLLAALGMAEVPVYRRPRAAVLSVGDELVAPDQAGEGRRGLAPEPGAVYDANSFSLACALEELGCEVTRLGVVPDKLAAVQEAVARGLEQDLLVVSGGASVGDRDFTLAALAGAGAQVLFTRLRIKPGKTVGFARLGQHLAFALPGSPGAAMTAFWLLVAPAVRALAGAPPEERQHPSLRARLMAPVKVRPGRVHYLWGRVVVCGGVPAVWPVGPSSTAVLRPQAMANGLILVPAQTGELREGEGVGVLCFGPLGPGVNWVPVPAISVVGPHNAGKTTLIEALVPELAARGLRVAALKHDVHGFQMDREGKDTWRLGRAGACPVGISGPPGAAVLWHGGERDLVRLLALLGEGVHLVLTEGYKSARTPKIEVVPEGQEPFSPPDELLAVVTGSPRPDRPGWLQARQVPALADRVVTWLSQWHLRARQAVGIA